ncbi:MAG TPA: VIT1/CCC1 transporter family protein [Candidatus Nanoarchaeia archaeon]|nr:VIT1/CCC1 transporter family protein [Candidatus Nanoarchaeia archaeon]
MLMRNSRRKLLMELREHQRKEAKGIKRANIRDFILGFQDGLVNTLGLVLGVAGAVKTANLVLISGLVTTFAESISMAAVAYTSTKAAKEYYESKKLKESLEIDEIPHMEREEIRSIYYKKGFRGKVLDKIVKRITSNRKRWLETMMREELRLYNDDYDKPLNSALLVGSSAVVGSLIPILPFFIFPVKLGMIVSLLFSIGMLFVVGSIKAKITAGSWKRRGLEMAVIGGLAALAGYLIGLLLGGIYA